MYKLQLLARAEQEVIEAYEWYEVKQSGLGKRFLKVLDQKFSTISTNPHQYQSRYGHELHVAPLKIFPYLIIYWIEEEQKSIFVTSVFHTSRKPKKH